MHSYIEGVEMENGPCPMGCEQSDTTILVADDRLHGLPGKFQIVRCSHCGLVRTNPRPTPASIGAYYPNDYAPYQSVSTDNPVVRGGLKHVLRSILGLGERRLPSLRPGYLLEIGCAAGNYLAEMQNLGWQAEGIEFSDAAALKAREKGFRVQTASVESAHGPKQRVDLVAAWMVLEHLHEPVHALRKIRQWVKPDGYLVASVPDFDCLERRLFKGRWYALQLPTHLFHYDRHSLKKLLGASGWSLESVRWQKNCSNLLWSIQYLLEDHGWRKATHGMVWLRTSRVAGPFRAALGWLLGVTHQSGRLEFTARAAQVKKSIHGVMG